MKVFILSECVCVHMCVLSGMLMRLLSFEDTVRYRKQLKIFQN